MDSKRINRNDKFCSSVKKKDVFCVLSNNDSIQCECAHIVPLNGEFGQSNYKNPDILNNSANGMLLSKDLHFLYDLFVWGINPNNYEEIEGIPKKHKYNIEISSNYKNKNISIQQYSTITLRTESHNFIEIAYNIFINHWNPPICYKLEIKENSCLNSFTQHKTYTTIDKLSVKDNEKLNNELTQIVMNGKNLSKQKKEEISKLYNVHHESIASYYNKFKKTFKTRNI
tara:strand:- start:856 stop:1539 length:684 start_codon:yes stop_codon:yes gene_type:complete